MTVVRHLGQAVLLLVLLGCVVRLLAVAIGNYRVQGDHAATVDDRPIWVRDQRGGGVLPGGDVGGDRQVSESFSVRFHHRDLPGVLVTYCYYAAVDEEHPATIMVERRTELMVCTSPDDPGGTEVCSADRHTTLPGSYANLQAATDAASLAARRHMVCEEPWSGRPPWSTERQEQPR